METTPEINKVGDPVPRAMDTYEKDYVDFVDLAVHELDAPLRKLGVFVDRLAAKFASAVQDKEFRSNIERIDNCVAEIRDLIDELSLLAKVGTEKRHFTPCNIGTIVQGILQGMLVPVNTKKAMVTVFPLPVIEADAGQLTRLFRNILENAIKFSRGEVAPEISIRSSALDAQEQNRLNLPGERTYQKIEIIDNGIGFRNEYAEKIFRPFVRLHGKSKYPGGGMGLAICRKIVENHQGLVYAEGREDQGARFILILPETR